jgi:hypothetical protein
MTGDYRGDTPLTIIIVSYNVASLLGDCLESVQAAIGGLGCEVIVVDNVSTDETIAVIGARFLEVRLIANQRNVGFAAANNQAISLCSSPYVLLLNPDTVVRPSALQQLYDTMEAHPEIGIVAPKIVNPDGTLQSGPLAFPTLCSLGGLGSTKREMLQSDLADADWVLGACMMVRRTVIDDIGMMDEGYFLYGEEKDWCFRAKRAGWQVKVLMDAEVVHIGGQSTKQCAPQSYVNLINSQVRFLGKFYPRSYRTTYLFSTLCTSGIREVAARLLSLGGNNSDDWGQRVATYTTGRRHAWHYLAGLGRGRMP